MHLALGVRARTWQRACIHALDLLEHFPLRDLGLLAPQVVATFPSWRRQHCLDHILLSPTLSLEPIQVLAQPNSDHLPVAVEFACPATRPAGYCV
jgi:endonuclease/exonuclease/phosphatase family metal-dependent hydrolase